MTDVIGCQQKPRLRRCTTAGRSAGPICIFAPEYPDTGDTTKQQSHQQLASAIRCGFDLH
jgi:hypothetical protein